MYANDGNKKQEELIRLYQFYKQIGLINASAHVYYIEKKTNGKDFFNEGVRYALNRPEQDFSIDPLFTMQEDQELHEAIQTLSRDERIPFVLTVFLGWTERTIQSVTGIQWNSGQQEIALRKVAGHIQEGLSAEQVRKLLVFLEPGYRKHLLKPPEIMQEDLEEEKGDSPEAPVSDRKKPFLVGAGLLAGVAAIALLYIMNPDQQDPVAESDSVVTRAETIMGDAQFQRYMARIDEAVQLLADEMGFTKEQLEASPYLLSQNWFANELRRIESTEVPFNENQLEQLFDDYLDALQPPIERMSILMEEYANTNVALSNDMSDSALMPFFEFQASFAESYERVLLQQHDSIDPYTKGEADLEDLPDEVRFLVEGMNEQALTYSYDEQQQRYYVYLEVERFNEKTRGLLTSDYQRFFVLNDRLFAIAIRHQGYPLLPDAEELADLLLAYQSLEDVVAENGQAQALMEMNYRGLVVLLTTMEQSADYYDDDGIMTEEAIAAFTALVDTPEFQTGILYPALRDWMQQLEAQNFRGLEDGRTIQGEFMSSFGQTDIPEGPVINFDSQLSDLYSKFQTTSEEEVIAGLPPEQVALLYWFAVTIKDREVVFSLTADSPFHSADELAEASFRSGIQQPFSSMFAFEVNEMDNGETRVSFEPEGLAQPPIEIRLKKIDDQWRVVHDDAYFSLR